MLIFLVAVDRRTRRQDKRSIQSAGQTAPWSRRRAKKAARLARIAAWMKGHVLETGAIVQALETLLEPGDAVALEGDNQKQADFLSRSLVQVDPARIDLAPADLEHQPAEHRHCSTGASPAKSIPVTPVHKSARVAGHPVVALIVGTALSGGLLAHGDQADRLLALDAPGVIVQAMRKGSAARIARRTVEELDELGKTVIPMAYEIRQFAKLGLLHELIAGIDADAASASQIAKVKERVAAAIVDIRKAPGDLTSRLNNAEAKVSRAASIEVRRRLAEQWNSP